MKLDRDFMPEDREKINPCNSLSIADALDFVKNPVKCCKHVHELIKNLMEIVQVKKEDLKTKGQFKIVSCPIPILRMTFRCNSVSWGNLGTNGEKVG